MASETITLEDEIRNGDAYTVVGYWVETLERYTLDTNASSPRQAEDFAHSEAKRLGGHLAVCGVFEGWHEAVDARYAKWVDPDATTQEEINRKRGELGWEPGLISPAEAAEVRRNTFGKKQTLLLIALVLIAFLLGVAL